jgi:hypothetical protein
MATNSTNDSIDFDSIQYSPEETNWYDKTVELLDCSVCGQKMTRECGSVVCVCFDCRMLAKIGREAKKMKKCTCGAEKTNNPNLHSDWCDKGG